MKKLFLLLTVSAILVACTTKEQDEKIQAFWAEQGTKASLKFGPAFMEGMMKAAPVMGKFQGKGEMSDEDMEAFMKMMQEMNQADGMDADSFDQQNNQPLNAEKNNQPLNTDETKLSTAETNLSTAKDEEDRAMINDSYRQMLELNQSFLATFDSSLYSAETRKKASSILASEEKQIKQLAISSEDFISFLEGKMQIEQNAHKQIEQLITDALSTPRQNISQKKTRQQTSGSKRTRRRNK